jgi:hypothetical protein
MLTFPSKDYQETNTIEFSFLEDLTVASIITATMTIDVHNGWDDHPGSVLVGAPTISDASVFQQVHGGVPNTIYRLTCVITTNDGRVLVIPANLPVSGYVNNYTENYLTVYVAPTTTSTTVIGSPLDKVRQDVAFAAASSAINYGLGGDVYISALTGNLTLVPPTGMVSGNTITYHFLQDGVGSRIVTFPNGVVMGSGAATNKLIVMFMFDGTDFVQLNTTNWH